MENKLMSIKGWNELAEIMASAHICNVNYFGIQERMDERILQKTAAMNHWKFLREQMPMAWSFYDLDEESLHKAEMTAQRYEGMMFALFIADGDIEQEDDEDYEIHAEIKEYSRELLDIIARLRAFREATGYTKPQGLTEEEIHEANSYVAKIANNR